MTEGLRVTSAKTGYFDFVIYNPANSRMLALDRSVLSTRYLLCSVCC